MLHSERHVFDRFAVIFSVVIVWVYAHFLTVLGPTSTSMRLQRLKLVGAAPCCFQRLIVYVMYKTSNSFSFTVASGDWCEWCPHGFNREANNHQAKYFKLKIV